MYRPPQSHHGTSQSWPLRGKMDATCLSCVLESQPIFSRLVTPHICVKPRVAVELQSSRHADSLVWACETTCQAPGHSVGLFLSCSVNVGLY